MMKKILRVFVQYMAVFVILAGALGATWPSTMQWVVPEIPWMLGLVMFGMGMTLQIADFKQIATRPWETCIGALCQYTIMPFAAWLLVKLIDLPPELAAGVILLGACPGGTASNVITYIARGDVALSVSMTIVTTLLAPIVTPLLTWWLAGAWIDVSVTSMMLSIAEMVLFPVFLGIAVRRFFGTYVEKVMAYLPAFSVLVIVLLVGGVVSMSASKLLEMGALIAMVVVLHNGLGLALGYCAARLFRLDDKKVRAVTIEVAMQNSGLAASLGVMYFGAAAAIPGAIFSIWHNISGSLIANYFVHKDEKAEALQLVHTVGENK